MSVKRFVSAAAALLLACAFVLPAFAEEAPEPAPPRTEAEWITVLESDADWHEKQAACRALRQIGTAAAVPALAPLLTEPELANLARYALEPMPYPEAGAALREALDRTEGLLQAGAAISLGVRRDAEAVSRLIPLLESPDADTASAAAGALGRIGVPEAVDALLAFAPEATGPMQWTVGDALLAAGENLLGDGEARRAVRLYESLLEETWPEHVRMGAFQGLCEAQPRQATRRLLRALGGPDPVFRDMAAQIVGEGGGGEGSVRRFANALPGLPSEGQAALLRGLAARRDGVARPAALRLVDDADREVRHAAVSALGALGNVEDAPRLIALMRDGEDETLAGIARASLRAIDDDAVNPLVAEAVESADDPAMRVALLELLAERLAPQTVGAATARLTDEDGEVRATSLQILTVLGGSDEAPAVIAALQAAESAAERGAAGRALGVICSREGAAVLPLLLDAMPGSPSRARQAMLRALSQIATPEALEALLAHLEDDDAEIQREAMRVLGNWPRQEAAPHLLALAESEDAAVRDTGLRGYVRLARENRDIEARSGMLRTAGGLIRRNEDAWLVLAAWGTVHTGEAIETVRPYLDQPETANEAASALIAIAEGVADHSEDARQIAIRTLEAVAAAAVNDPIRERAASALERLR